MAERVQRLLVNFGCDNALKYISHLDLMRVWERVLRRAGVPVLYSEGFSPHPRIALASPLAVGVSSEAEKLDIVLERRVKTVDIEADLLPQLPRGMTLLGVEELPLKLPSLQSLTRAARYSVEVEDDRTPDAWRTAITELLARESIPWEHSRGDNIKRYDLRPLLYEIELVEAIDGHARLHLRLRNDEQGAGRPEQVTRALGVAEEPLRIHRLALELEMPSIARTAARRARYEAC